MTRVAFSICLAVALAGAASAECRVPHFYTGRDFIDSHSGRGSLFISIRPADLAIGNLICLSQALRSQHENWRDVGVLIFTSSDAARNFQPSHADYENPAAWTKAARELHASYFFNAEKHEEYLEIMPLGYKGPPSYNSRIDLPMVTAATCHLQIRDRCLLALEDIDYPSSALRAGQSGVLLLSGVIAQNGQIKGIRVVNEAAGGKVREELASAALQNFRTWHFEPSHQTSEIRIKYSYEISSSAGSSSQMSVQLELPDLIIIRAVASGSRTQ